MDSILDNYEIQELIKEHGKDKIISIIKKRKSFCLYFDNFPVLSKLSNEQAGLLFKNIVAYESMGTMLDMDEFMEYAFEFIKPRLDSGLVEYIRQSITNAINGAKGGKAKAENRKPTKEEFVEYCTSNGKDRQHAEAWFDELEKAEWRYAGKQIEDWKAYALEKVR